MSFSELGLRAELLRAVEEQGYTTPTPIQRQAIPAVLKGGDLLASAQTGTGKTAGFTLPLLQRLAEGPRPQPKQIRALVLTPTRELAAQVGDNVAGYGRHLKLRSHVIFGGVGQQPQVDAIRPGLDILVATPGRLLDLHQQRHVDLSRVETLVLDEADRMLDMGFIHDIKKLLRLLPEKRQNLLFSATFSDEIQQLANKLLDRPTLIEVARRNTTAESVDQAIYRVDREKKRDLLAHLIKRHQWYQVLVFTRTKHGANRLAEQLGKQDIPAMAIHGNKSQSARTRALSAFKDGSLQVLVATDIAARGLDISELPHVVNFELPNVAEDYVHRIGRTGRAGSEGQAVSLVCVDEHALLRNIERMIKRDLPKHVEPGFEPDPNAKPEPIENGRGGKRGSNRGNGGNAARNRPDARSRNTSTRQDGDKVDRARRRRPQRSRQA
ncbi:ATP-dependent RNA helicase RhlE [Modicisalibacter ilicicola DSM 19980]|uniref:ATP-dependent RNA helicase RhlE n=1 Tax=Modicisalibacter ilicicola DSM 19980 TaxID=1121942 RepID=A0A1M5CKA3_9GAMM|nr:DEAD/DEAH box helicase [Halomonas ilicicola]SHF55184.1 ATP-dependent RNA helicase RhlE [Halomonas ilicicola DSM 19980]